MGIRPTHLRHVICRNVPDLELDILSLVGDVAHRGDVAVVAEGEGLGPHHSVSSDVEVDWRLLLPSQAGAGPFGRSCGKIKLGKAP